MDLSRGHKKIILYANPGTEGFYAKLGFLRMNTAMAIWQDQARAVESGLLRAEPLTHGQALAATGRTPRTAWRARRSTRPGRRAGPTREDVMSLI